MSEIPKISLSKLYVGNIDARDEADRSDFLELFYDNDQMYSDSLKPIKFIITGRKGTGKSLLAYYIKNKSELESTHNVEIRSLNEFSLHKLKQLGNRVPQLEELNILWKWVIYYEYAKKLISINKLCSVIPTTSIYKLKKFIESFEGDKKKPYILKAFSKSHGSQSKSSSGTKNDIFEAAFDIVQTNQLNKVYGPKMYYQLIDELERLVLNALRKSEPILLLFDNLDELEGRVEDNNFYRNLLLSLIETSKSINYIIRGANENHKTILLIRNDILRVLMNYSTNLNKSIGDCKISLNWIKKDISTPYEHPLMVMILNKIKSSCIPYADLSDEVLYKHLFPSLVKDNDPLTYLLHNSFGRPRDIIKFLNLIIEHSGDDYQFKASYFTDSLKEYSIWFYDELRNELKIHEKKDFLFDSIELVKSIAKTNFTYNAAKIHYEEFKDHYQNIENLDEALVKLYQFGVIGISWKKPKRSKYDNSKFNYQWGYRDDSDLIPDLTKTFVVHYGIKRAFSI